jgi:EAL domain-containing protein (putative c-di-GMP-specific phosphodiesterase class I)
VRMEGDHAALAAAVGDARAAGMTIGARNLASRADWEVARSLGVATATGSCVGVALAADLFAREVERRPAWKGFA